MYTIKIVVSKSRVRFKYQLIWQNSMFMISAKAFLKTLIDKVSVDY